jgi:F-type H+-transporting ATPase subunit a
MIAANPLAPEVLFRLGPVPVSGAVATSWAIMAVLAGGSYLVTRRMAERPGRVQAVAEALVEAIAGQIEETMRVAPRPFLPLVGTLFLFVLACNLSPVLPGVKAPTARIETTGALALIVFVAVHGYGIRARGLRRYLGHYLEPTPLLAPLTVLAEFTRTLALMVRLFGNVMSHELVIAVMLSLAGLLLPVPIMALGLLIGAVQAYIISVLASVFLGAAVGAVEAG